MSEAGSHCNDATSEDSLIDSMVTGTSNNSEEFYTPKILCGLEGLRQKKDSHVMSSTWKTKLAPSIANTSCMSSPLVPFQMVSRPNQLETSYSQSTRQESCSEPMSPSLLPQTDRWTESFSVIPSFMKKKLQRQGVESQSQSLLPQTGPQTHARTDNMTLQPSRTRSSGSASATISAANSQKETEEATKPDKEVTQPSKKQKKQKIKKKMSAVNTTAVSFIRSSTEASGVPDRSNRRQELLLEKTSKKRPDSLLIPTQSSAKSSEASDVTDKINQRIEKQLAQLEHAPRKKMLAIEAAVVHCVTSMQDNIEKKLARLKHSYSTENADILRKLLQTLKSTLGRLIEHQRQEREQFAAATQTSLSQMSEVEMMVQTTQLMELGKRQKTVVGLLAKQRDLASKLKKLDSADEVGEERETNVADVNTTMNKIPNRENVVTDNNNNIDLTGDDNVADCLDNDAEISLFSTDNIKEKQNKKPRKHKETNNKKQTAFDQETCSEKVKKNIEKSTASLSKKEDISLSNNSSSVVGHTTQESGSGLLDILKILGNSKRQKSISELARSVDELASGSNSEILSTSAMAVQDSFRDDATVGSGYGAGRVNDNNKMADNIEVNGPNEDVANIVFELPTSKNRTIRDSMYVGPDNEAESLNYGTSKIPDSFEVYCQDKNVSNVAELARNDDNMNLGETRENVVMKEIHVKEVVNKEIGVTEKNDDFEKENIDDDVKVDHMEKIDDLVLSHDEVEKHAKESEKNTTKKSTKNKNVNQDIIMREDIRNQKEKCKETEMREKLESSIADKEKITEKEPDICDKNIRKTSSTSRFASNIDHVKSLNESVKNVRASVEVFTPSVQCVPPSVSDKSSKRSLSDYDPSTGGIDPRSVYGQTKAAISKTVPDDINDDSSPKAIAPKAFYKHSKQDKTRDEKLSLDIAGCVVEKEDDVLLSQDVTTIPDTQDPSTQETLTRDSPVTSSQFLEKTGRKRKQSTSSDEKVPSRKKYTKITQEEGTRKIDDSTRTQNEMVSEDTEADKTETKIVPYEPVNMFNGQVVDSVLLKNNVEHVYIDSVVDFQNKVERQNALAQRRVANDDNEKTLGLANYKKLKETNALPERLWAEMLKQDTDKYKTSMKDTKVTNHISVSMQKDLEPFKSPGEKLDRVIKRIREEKENKDSGKVKDSSLHIDNTDTSFKTPESDKSSNIKEVGNQWLKNRDAIIPSGKFDVNCNSLQQAGLAVGLALPQDQTMLPKQVASKPVPESTKNDNSLMFSPPRPIPDENYTDVSPTATSMSSDVFLVKAKELDRRMKLRAEMWQQLASQTESQRTNAENNGGKQTEPRVATPAKMDTFRYNKNDIAQSVKSQITSQNKGNWISVFPKPTPEKLEESIVLRQSQATVAGIDKTMKTKTSAEKIEAVIDDVIKSAAALTDEKECSRNKIPSQKASSHKAGGLKHAPNYAPYISDESNPVSCQASGRQMITVKTQGQKFTQPVKVTPVKVLQVGSKVPGHRYIQPPDRRQAIELDSSQDMLGNSQMSESFETQGNTTPIVDPSKPVLPTLKTMLQSGVLKPGTNVLSVLVKNQTITASLTPLGMIRSMRGEIFKTPMQWLMSLAPDRGVIKRRRAYERITYNRHTLLSYCSCTNNINQTTSEQTTTSQDRSEVKGISDWDDTDEGRLNKFLSTCRIRLLSKEDLIPCDDLPDNFWANDFADVKVPSDIWECVDMWD